jgi:hypothetical protein
VHPARWNRDPGSPRRLDAIDRLIALLEESSFIEILRLDGVLYQHQPVLVARRGTG